MDNESQNKTDSHNTVKSNANDTNHSPLNDVSSQNGNKKPTIWLTRHGQSEYNLDDRIGGNPPLTERGHRYAKRLSIWFREEIAERRRNGEGEIEKEEEKEPIEIWTSALQRTIQTVAHLSDFPQRHIETLNEIESGICDGMSYAQIQRDMPDIHRARNADKLRFRYPQGESYLDLVERLTPIINQILERKHPLLIIAHQAVVRVLVCRLLKVPDAELPHFDTPLETVFKLEEGEEGLKQTRIGLDCSDGQKKLSVL